jgi:DNA polymerase I-like protein with 3'-5' exonuclease and polymerase domains/5'-3' exonuclease/intein/homing endonuclease
MKRLVLIDGNALLHRAYHATPPLSTTKGELINAVYGFTSMLLKGITDLTPDYIAVAWDMKAPTFRHQAYTQYKATRGPADDALSGQYTRVHQIVESLNIPEFSLSGYEADDLIGTLAFQAKKVKNLEVIVLTGDRDIMQIIDKNIKILMPRKTLTDVGLYGVEEFREKWGFEPKQLIEYKALAGDQSDNIPGVAGIGDKTATKLIQDFGNIEKIYLPKNLKTLPPRTQTLLAEGAESAVMSKKLATLDLEAPIKLDLAACMVHDYDYNKAKELFGELEFKSMVSRLPGHPKGALDEQLSLPEVSKNDRGEQNQHTTDLDLAVMPVLEKMTKTGILVDLGILGSLGKSLKERLIKLEAEIYASVGHEFNINSPKQLQEILFDELKLPVYRRTKTGRSTDEQTLQELSTAHPLIPLLLAYRKLFKLVSTYIDALPKSVQEDGRIHSTFNVEGAATGRLSSINPNLQNIPIRGELGGEMRKAFIAPKGQVLLAADYSQIELRIMAHLSGDENLKKAFKENIDIHVLTASKIFSIPVEEVSSEQRAVGKTMNFATLYGQGARALSQQLKVEYAVAKLYITEYFEQFPKVKDWMARILAFGYENGFVETIWGRRRYIPELQAGNRILRSFGERAAINHPVQGCLPWNTKILTSEGYIPVGELSTAKKKPQHVWDGTEWKSYEVLNRGESQLAKIKFSNGQILKCDIRHKVLTVDENGYKWTEFSQLVEGTKVCFSMPLVHEFPSRQFSYKHQPKVHNGIPLELVGDKEFWYWLGYYIGDGYLLKKWNRGWVYSLTYFFGEHEVEKRQQCLNFFSLLGLHPKLRKATHRPHNKISTRYNITIHSQGLGKVFESIGLFAGKVASTKKLPPRIFTESIENRSAFIKGIMDSDGYNAIKEQGNPNIHLCQREILQEILILLKTLGVESQIRGPYVYNDKISYRLEIHRNALVTILQQGEVSYYSRYLKKLAPQFLIKETVASGGYLNKSQYATGSDYVLFSRWKNGGTSSLYHLQTWLKRNNVKLQTPIYQYHEIVEIEVLDEFEITFTLSVPGSHRFDSEGVISKNTSADMIKQAMVEIDKELTMNNEQLKKKNDSELLIANCSLILQIHDELLFECTPEQLEATAKMVKEKMENALKLDVPVVVDLKSGQNWGEMKKIEI